MVRGTTPENIFKLPFILDDVKSLYVTYSQGNTVVLDKAIDDVIIDGNTITVKLTQEDTLKFSNAQVNIQIRFKTNQGKAMASNIISTYVNNVLKDGVI